MTGTRLGLRVKLFIGYMVLVAVAITLVGVRLDDSLNRMLIEGEERQLRSQAQVVKEMMEALAPSPRITLVDPLVVRLGKAMGNRITVIAADGTVLGDSELDYSEVPGVERHGDRPEVLQALAEGTGVSSRHSTTLDRRMLYVAVVLALPEWRGVVRVAKSLQVVDESISQQRWLLLAAGIGILLLAGAISGLTSYWVMRRIRVMMSKVLGPSAIADLMPGWQDDLVVGLISSTGRLTNELERAMATLSRERNRMEAVLHGMVEGVVALDRDSRIMLVNPAAMEMLNLPDAPEARRLDTLVPVDELLQVAGEAIQGSGGQCLCRMGGRQERHLLFQAAPIADGEGCVLVARDVTDIARVERMRRDFVANASHELRTPVGIILANAETLLDGALEDPTFKRRLVEAIERQGTRMARLVEDMMSLSRLEGGGHLLNPGRLPLQPLGRRIVESLEGRARAQGVELVIHPGKELVAWADGEAVERVLLNLLANALAHVPAGSRVVVAIQGLGERARILVEDNGPGIPPDHFPRLFERFYRVDAGRSRDKGGTGLGLAIVKHLVENMEGEVGVEEVQPRGVRFWFTLPLAPGTDAAEPRQGGDRGGGSGG